MVIASSAIILKDKKILLVKRSDYTPTFPNTWACPGGRADNNETPEQAVIRELKEELNLNFKPVKLFKKGKWKNRRLYRFLGEWDGKIKVQEEEIDDFGWFSYEEAVKLNLGFDYKEIIEKLHKKDLL